MAAKKTSKKKKEEIRKAMFANMDAAGETYPKNSAGKRAKPRKKKK